MSTDATRELNQESAEAGERGGVPNKATLERTAVAERVMQEAAMSGKKLGKPMIEEFAVMFGGLVGGGAADR